MLQILISRQTCFAVIGCIIDILLCCRYLKQAVVDKSAVVASAVLVSAFHLLSQNNEIVKRWTNEIQEAMQSKHSMVQFHAVALLHALRANDRLAVSKLVSSLVKGSVRSVMHSMNLQDTSSCRSLRSCCNKEQLYFSVTISTGVLSACFNPVVVFQ